VPGTHVSTAHFIFGTFVWATPDGRKAGERFSDNIGPADQRDMTGPTAHINSVTKLGVERQIGTIHNMYLTNVDSDDKRHKMIDLIDAYHGRAAQPDVVLEADLRPFDLALVRVAAQLPRQLRALREAGRAERVALGDRP
jgi:formate C-acetyltransferase